MSFWDSSAIVPLVCREPESARCRAWLRADPVIVIWVFTIPEVMSALCRKRREDRLTQRTFAVAKTRLHKIEQAWNEVVSYDTVRARARRGSRAGERETRRREPDHRVRREPPGPGHDLHNRLSAGG